MTFTAQYDGICGNCDEPIRAGQEITGPIAGDYMHVVCPVTVPRPAAALCPICHLEMPASGVCGVCD